MKTFDHDYLPDGSFMVESDDGSGEYVKRESAEKLYEELERCRAVLVQEQFYTLAESVDAALRFADEN